MTQPDGRFGVWLGHARVGTLHQQGDHTRFAFHSEYLSEPRRPVLGLLFEQDLRASHAAALRLPCWFSNLLPEGRLRDWIAKDRKVSPQREMELLAQVGHDLPGAVRVIEVDDEAGEPDWAAVTPPDREESPPETMAWRFSLAGVALKFSMLAKGDRLTMPAFGAGGDWIVKLPDHIYPDLPRNEFTMMSLAGAAGIDVPEVRLVQRDDIEGLPADVWPSTEDWAYAVRRFDRSDDRGRIHIEDLAQVRNVYPEAKYRGNYETVAGLVYRGHDLKSLRQFVRRLVFNVLISNGDAHLKNWSLRYADPRVPALAPAYDLVSTRFYMGGDEQLGLKFAGSRQLDAMRLTSLARLERRLGAEDAGLADEGADVVERVLDNWDRVADVLAGNRHLQADVAASIVDRSRTLRAARAR